MLEDQFHNKHTLAHTINQLQPQKLSQQLWIGPLNSIAQREFLLQNNIKYIIGILPCHKCCYYLKDFDQNQFTCISIDPDFDISKLTEIEGHCLMQFNSKFTSNIVNLTNNKISNSIITNLNIQKLLQDYLILINSIRENDSNANILLFSMNGNDNLFSLFTIAFIQDFLNCDIQQSYNYLKSIRPSINEIVKNSGYYNELMKFEINNRARKQFDLNNLNTGNNLKSKRSISDLDDQYDAELESPRIFKKKF
ncbi:hypothetical protein WICMUC_002773 [Wickerhamomyces mucosus]|uniref:Uncharacterized protein n=1 Tax=Wickerhamomyces mucosus TaxID=1378264 RepID=A0A9P8PP86_9ASCO|nr:hypothetical protein WICMUC_002773 [Wickerhamomyces mucosus]